MSSTNKTANLQLNQWVATDPVLMADFNADNQKLDAAFNGLCHMMVGSYVGDGAASRSITLGIRPKAVLLLHSGMAVQKSPNVFGGLVIDGSSANRAITLTSTGFTVYVNTDNSNERIFSNNNNTTFLYLALY